ncbi:MAG: hydrogenase maturation protease [Bryobacteraceae bacterium]
MKERHACGADLPVRAGPPGPVLAKEATVEAAGQGAGLETRRRRRRLPHKTGVVVIGYGNSLRGDDGAGPFVANHIPGAIACHQLTPELAEPISKADRVIFVDAHAGVPAGQISIRPVAPCPSSLLHRCDPATLLAWSQQLYGRAPEAILIGIGAGSFDLGEGLSPQARRGAHKALRAIPELCRAFPTGSGTMQLSR